MSIDLTILISSMIGFMCWTILITSIRQLFGIKNQVEERGKKIDEIHNALLGISKIKTFKERLKDLADKEALN